MICDGVSSDKIGSRQAPRVIILVKFITPGAQRTLKGRVRGAGVDMPKWCLKSSVAITCSAADEDTLKQLREVLLMEVLVDFVLFDTSHKKCSCPMVNFVKSLKETDVVVLTNSTCELEEYKNCGADVPGVTSVSVAGLLISPTDSKMKWAIKHHVIDLWNKAKVLKESWQRIIIFRAIIKDVSVSVVKLGDAAAKHGESHLVFGDVPPKPVPEPLQPEVRPVNMNLKEELWDMDAQKHEKAAKAFAEGVEDIMSELEQFDAFVGGESAAGGAAAPAQKSTDERVKQVNEAVMQADLENQLAQIKQDLKRKGRRKRRENSMSWLNKTQSALPPRRPSRSSSLKWFLSGARRYRREKSKTTKANFMPFKIFVGGDYASVFDSVAIDLASSIEANLPKHKLLLVQEAQAVKEAPTSSQEGSSENEAPIVLPNEQESNRLASDPVRLAMLAEGGAADDIDDLTEDDVVDELNSEIDYQNLLEEEERRLSQMSKSTRHDDLDELVHSEVAVPPVAAAARAGGVASKAAPHSDDIEEEKRRAREQDHIFKNFIVFIVAIIGIIIIFAVLVIMSMKRRPSKEDLDFFQRARERQMWEHEQLLAQGRNIFSNYDGVTPQQSPFGAFSQPTYIGGDRDQMRPRGQPEVVHSDWAPPLNMDAPLLGGRHVITEFDEVPQPKSTVSQVEQI
ncbi:hypothetical protein RRG08_063972 [Elysia crispata]|uniref:Uncharacterized protein n=1 Tax=Elysia crispata TaxID=231223 RepID=A0AAE1CY29_9GAST|nr:hypothetical protein RRG08_063972 [Elysia crispata]